MTPENGMAGYRARGSRLRQRVHPSGLASGSHCSRLAKGSGQPWAQESSGSVVGDLRSLDMRVRDGICSICALAMFSVRDFHGESRELVISRARHLKRHVSLDSSGSQVERGQELDFPGRCASKGLALLRLILFAFCLFRCLCET